MPKRALSRDRPVRGTRERRVGPRRSEIFRVQLHVQVENADVPPRRCSVSSGNSPLRERRRRLGADAEGDHVQVVFPERPGRTALQLGHEDSLLRQRGSRRQGLRPHRGVAGKQPPGQVSKATVTAPAWEWPLPRQAPGPTAAPAAGTAPALRRFGLRFRSGSRPVRAGRPSFLRREVSKAQPSSPAPAAQPTPPPPSPSPAPAARVDPAARPGCAYLLGPAPGSASFPDPRYACGYLRSSARRCRVPAFGSRSAPAISSSSWARTSPASVPHKLLQVRPDLSGRGEDVCFPVGHGQLLMPRNRQMPPSSMDFGSRGAPGRPLSGKAFRMVLALPRPSDGRCPGQSPRNMTSSRPNRYP